MTKNKEENTNLDLWNKVDKTNPNDTKEVSFGRKFTAIDAYSQIKKATELWGSYGSTWGLYDIKYEFLETYGLCMVSANFKYPRLLSDSIDQTNKFEISTSIAMASKKGPDHDFAKKAETDLLTKALSKLGFNADIFLGKFDDNKYVAQMKEEFREKVIGEISGEEVDMGKVKRAVNYIKTIIDADIEEELRTEKLQQSGEKLDDDERMQVDKLLNDKAPNTKRKYKNIFSDYTKAL